MRTIEASIRILCREYDVQITLAESGAIVYYKNISESDVIPFDEEITLNYFLDNFEMVADLSKLQMNLSAIEM